MNIAYFITPHGYGHAARASAVMNAILLLIPDIHFEIFTTVPKWFFTDSLAKGSFTYHSKTTDIGLVQNSPLSENLSETIKQLSDFIPFNPKWMVSIIQDLENLDCEWIFSDISPLGVHLANRMGIPSVLVENFTWDWIYKAYTDAWPEIQFAIDYYSDIYSHATYRIQSEPVCLRMPNSALVTNPVSRPARSSRSQVRKSLGIAGEAGMILITLGGIQASYSFIDSLGINPDIFFVIPGIPENLKVPNNVLRLPHHSKYYHPDLINASDAVVGKVGYSTLAEVYNSNIPFGYIPRPGFRESPVIENYIKNNIAGMRIPENDFHQGPWIKDVDRLCQMTQPDRTDFVNGANQIAELFQNLIADSKLKRTAELK